MAIGNLLSELNKSQYEAACMPRQHALVLAGAGTGKTKTIVARAAYLISNGTPAHRIQILAFTRRSASEIVERVRMHLGDDAQDLKASTFHTWCMSLIRIAPKAFGRKGYSVIDTDDQLQLFKVVRGKARRSELPSAKEIRKYYSLARNMEKSLSDMLQEKAPEYYRHIKRISEIMLAYEERKRERHYLDYDDILDVVAKQITVSEKTRAWVSGQYDHILVDEMQDTNPLQWKLIDPLKENVTLFCVGDDAQSIYGFRGADFRNVHNFTTRVSNSVTLKLQDNYRSTQEILDTSNWLLSQSALKYGKNLRAMRGTGRIPELHTFISEWEEGRWIAADIFNKKKMGSNWKSNMILVRSGFAGKVIEGALLAREIPYRFIGGIKLLESAHIRDLLSVLRIVGNQQDEIAWMRFLTLWHGVGEATANKIIENVLFLDGHDQVIKFLEGEEKLPLSAANAVDAVVKNQNNVFAALQASFQVLEEILAARYKNRDWDKRRRDIPLVKKLTEKHTSILGFVEEYLLDPITVSQIRKKESDDVVTVITIHSAKGTECERCYVINVSPGAYPSSFSIGNEDEVEEERRVLYVALTRAKDDLIVTRRGYSTWAVKESATEENAESETYFFNALPEGLFDEIIHTYKPLSTADDNAPDITEPVDVGINIGIIPPELLVEPDEQGESLQEVLKPNYGVRQENNLFYAMVDLQQGTYEWLKWRSQGIGASDAPTIMGENLWKSMAKLRQEKLFSQIAGTDLFIINNRNPAMEQGVTLEAEARKKYESKVGIRVNPVCLQSTKHEWQRASLDGMSEDGRTVVEIKCGESVYHKASKSRTVPDYYYGQLQHILSVTHLPSIDFYCYLPGRPEVHLSVLRDDQYIERLLEVECLFWRKIHKK